MFSDRWKEERGKKTGKIFSFWYFALINKYKMVILHRSLRTCKKKNWIETTDDDDDAGCIYACI